MNTTPDTDVAENTATVAPVVEGNGSWQLFAHKVTEIDYHIAGRPPVAGGLITAVSPEGEIHTFEFTSGGATFTDGRAREMLPGLSDDIDNQAGNGAQGVYGLDFDNYNNYHANSTGSQFANADGTGSQLRLQNADGMNMEGRNGFLIHTRSGNIPNGSAGCLVLTEVEEQRFFGLMEEIRAEDPSALPTHLTVLGDDDPSKETINAFEVAHATGNMDGERTVSDEVTDEMVAIAENSTFLGRNNKFAGMDDATMLAFISSQTQQELMASGNWESHDGRGFGSQRILNIQTDELKNYYPQEGTEGLSGRAAKIAGDGKLGEITHHAVKLQQDEDGSYAKAHIEDSLQSNSGGDSWLMKLDASLNREAELTGDTEVVPVDGVFREADNSRVTSFIETHRAENNGEVFELGNAAVKHMLRTGSTVESLAELSGMDTKTIEAAQQTHYGSAAAISIDDPALGGVLDVIANAEGTAGDNGYNAAFDHGNGQHGVDFSTMTVDQVQAWSRNNGFGSSATGRYQVMADTMTDVKRGMGLSGQEMFTPELQDQIGVFLLERRGLNSYLNGEISTDRMVDNMAREWAGVSTSSGRSVYEGVGHNKATGDNSDATRHALENLRESYQNPAPKLEDAPVSETDTENLHLSSADKSPDSMKPDYAAAVMEEANRVANDPVLSAQFVAADANRDPELVSSNPVNTVSEKPAGTSQSFDTAVAHTPEEKVIPAVADNTPEPEAHKPMMA